MINNIQMPEIATALFRLPGLRRASGSAGRLVYEGPFPDRLVVTFDAEPDPARPIASPT